MLSRNGVLTKGGFYAREKKTVASRLCFWRNRLISSHRFTPPLRDHDGLHGFVVVGDNGRETVCGADLAALAPDLVSEIERFLAHARDTTSDRDLFMEIERPLVV